MTDKLTLSVSGEARSDWTEISVTRGCEHIPNSFEVALATDKPGETALSGIKGGEACTVEIGGDKVLTGYVDRVVNRGSPAGHEVRIIGRGKCQDLVDCSAEWDGALIKDETALGIAQKLAQPYGIAASLGSGASPGGVILQFVLEYSASPVELIERVTRHAGLLFYEDADGNLLLAIAGSKEAGGGVAYGKNVQQWSVSGSVDQRFAEIGCTLVSLNPLAELGDAGYAYFVQPDPGVARHRALHLVADQSYEGNDLCQKRAIWEVARRGGRGTVVRAIVDSWRDSSGKVWEPNTLAPVKLPGLIVDGPLCISEVTYRRDNETGTTAELVLMPKKAFMPEPILLPGEASPAVEAI